LGPGYSSFVNWMVEAFAGTVLPTGAVSILAITLPFLETGIGFCILAGLFRRWALVAGGLLMTVLVTGQCILQAWDVVALQMIYSLCYFAALYFGSEDRITLDHWLLLRKNSK
jgi:uncharacterized membrane protein YphA (DoxX/SURF4 family)